MDTLYQILAILAAGVIVWFLWRTVKGSPEQFSRENLSKSAGTLGVLALLLIAFVAFLVFLLRMG
ncbi:hypothetical protein Lgee_0107 [Legionella geestiana]|uniref:Uncharacterized protein n=1 Tax=Legionella geestiana TaxID=45065 RepID=A0A0W0U9P6_9GAMM|nr:hypothetical protein [Legionella geestiana]KTD04497.1 hypothetical protein Lgee_0107 [Legionella geestiana]QBS12266.1 hypothetical protein E4T54_05625 [Legionella geestiana]QDQ40021.1 hypothetical protein E3226_006215 [Legionella geestiana]STX52999.1 Uncharacterised protein [Legionella geestiana]